MPKFFIEYSFPDDGYEFLASTHAVGAFTLLHELDEYLRGRLKYGELTEPVREELQAVRDVLLEGMREFPGELR